MRISHYPPSKKSMGSMNVYLTLEEAAQVEERYGPRFVLTEINDVKDILLLKPDPYGFRLGGITEAHRGERRITMSAEKLQDLVYAVPYMGITDVPMVKYVEEGVMITLPSEFHLPRKLDRKLKEDGESTPKSPMYTLENAARFLESELARMQNPSVRYEGGKLIIEQEEVVVTKTRIYG